MYRTSRQVLVLRGLLLLEPLEQLSHLYHYHLSSVFLQAKFIISPIGKDILDMQEKQQDCKLPSSSSLAQGST